VALKKYIKCKKCNKVLIHGKNLEWFSASGTSLNCEKCGEKYLFDTDLKNKITFIRKKPLNIWSKFD